MKFRPLLTLLFFYALTCHNVVAQRHPVYVLESRLMQGDKKALYEIAPYFDSKKKVIEHLSHHVFKTPESEIAKRIVAENCLFTDEEIRITNSTSAKEFLDFLDKNKDKIVFSNLATAFLITPLENRDVTFEIRALSAIREQELESATTLLKPDWVKASGVDSLIQQKNPLSLLVIASELVKIRTRFNRYNFNESEFTDLLKYLTGVEIGVRNEFKEIAWYIDKDYGSESKLNLLIFFSKFYSQYSWDKKQSVFVNPNHIIRPLEKEEALFQLLNNNNGLIALDAFTELTVCSPDKVTKLADEYESISTERSETIPIFPYKFLKQLVLLTDYCRTNTIDFTGSKQLQTSIALLRTELSFVERRRLEDKLIQTLSFDDITALEYWTIINESSDELVNSAGRILDIFYSKNWKKLLTDKKQLDCYLKKSAWFDNLGIIGTCNNYLKKFTNSSPTTLMLLKNYETTDKDIKAKIDSILANKNKTSKKEKSLIVWDGNRDYEVRNLEEQLAELIKNIQDSAKTDNKISELLSRINYQQIPAALKAIENYRFQTDWEKYSFMERDWGFFLVRDFNKKEVREEFLRLYDKFSEYQLYEYYLDQGEIDYKTGTDTLDYDKIYDLLKYDVVEAFVGGGGGKKDNEVYSLVKLLELTFKTTLKHPHKLCNSNNIYGCDSEERAQAWMSFLIDKKLLKEEHSEPVSFHYE